MHKHDNAISVSFVGLALAGPFGDEDWYLIEVDQREISTVLSELRDALEAAGVECVERVANDPIDLLRHPSLTQRCVLLCTPNLSAPWSELQYAKFDQLRSLTRERWPRMIWITDRAGLERMVHSAPNIFAFFGASVGRWSDGTMSVEDTERHLAALRARYSTSDEEIVRRAERGELEQDADFHTWLILLGRGDLIPHDSGAGI